MLDWGFLSGLRDDTPIGSIGITVLRILVLLALAEILWIYGITRIDWSLLSRLLQYVQTPVSLARVWTYLIRMVVLFGPAKMLWADSLSSFKCNTTKPVCTSFCHSYFYPYSPFLFLMMEQTILTLVPPVWYLRWATPAPPGRTRIWTCLHCLVLLVNMIVETAFACIHYKLYGLHMPSEYICNAEKVAEYGCTRSTACFIPYPKAKNVVINFMLVLNCLSVILNVLEMVLLLCRRTTREEQQHQHLP